MSNNCFFLKLMSNNFFYKQYCTSMFLAETILLKVCTNVHSMLSSRLLHNHWDKQLLATIVLS